MHVLSSRKLVSTVVIVVVAVLAFTMVLDTAVNQLGMLTMTQRSTTYLERWTNQALATAATAGIINAGLSVVEDSELQLAPVGVGASIAVGDAVRPVNDMASRVLSVALISAVSLEIQQILIKIGASVGIKWFLGLSLVFLAFAVWLDWRILRRLAWGFFVLALVARLLIPGAILLAGAVGDRYTNSAYAEVQREFQKLGSDVTKTKDLVVKAIPTPGDVIAQLKPGFLGGDKSNEPSFDQVKAQVSALLGRLANTADKVNRYAVTYFGVFIVQTILLPVLILWGLIKLPGFSADSGRNG